MHRNNAISTRRGQAGNKTLIGNPMTRKPGRKTATKKNLAVTDTHHRDPEMPGSPHTRGVAIRDHKRRPELPQTAKITAKTPRIADKRRWPGKHRLHGYKFEGPTSAQEIEGLRASKEQDPMTAKVEFGGDRPGPRCVTATATVNKMGDDRDTWLLSRL